MTYRHGRSYVRFPEKFVSTPESELVPASHLMDRMISEEKNKRHLRDHPAIVKSQNVFDSLDE